ncbi:MAG: hypothetical protein ABI861_00790 [Panacibacter sp.]
MNNKLSISDIVIMLLLSGFIAGTLNALGSLVIYHFILENATSVQVLQSPLGGIIGKSFRIGGQYDSTFYGIILYYLINFFFALIYFLISEYILHLNNYKILKGLLYGLLLSIFMIYIIIPITGITQANWSLNSISIIILMFFVGIPISFTNHYYRNTSNHTYHFANDNHS